MLRILIMVSPSMFIFLDSRQKLIGEGSILKLSKLIGKSGISERELILAIEDMVEKNTNFAEFGTQATFIYSKSVDFEETKTIIDKFKTLINTR